ncbi:MAG: TlpA family protein disulfide reductase [candidate division Zixibacteria bacterium]|nr:TlpA family protein disulfide reductase [candidate division Zixibacteria bacterium]
MKRFAIILVTMMITLLAGNIMAENYDQADFNSKFSAITDESKFADLCKDFMLNAKDIDVIRNVQSQWENSDPEAAKQFSKELYDKNSNSEKYTYLYGRVVDTPVEKIKLGRKTIQLSMMWPYGYRLMLATYMTSLFDAPQNGEYVDELKTLLAQDEKHFKTLIQLEPKESYPLRFYYSFQKYKNDNDGALETLNKAKELQAPWVNQGEYATIYAKQGKYEKALQEITALVDLQGIPADERDMYIGYYYKSVLTDAGAYQQAIDYLKAQAEYAVSGDVKYDVACVFALKGDTENAFTELSSAAAAGYDMAKHAEQDTDLTDLHADSRWEGFLNTVKKNWIEGTPKRKENALAAKISDSVAPTWSLEDKDGNIVNLADLKGTVVVLDFWATWCGPCRMAMPVLSDFVLNKANENVKVFSVNVWESSPNKAVPLNFMKDNEYAMTLIYGTKEVAQSYGVQGIPFICVIDKEGNIRYSESGFSENLEENLVWWTEDLL